MRACTFVEDGTVGTRRYKAGETANLPEAFVRALVRRGVATDSPLPVVVVPARPPMTVDPVPAQADEANGAEGEQEQPEAPKEPAIKPLSKRALKRLLRGKS